MTPREIEVMQGKNVIFLILISMLFGPFINGCPPWGAKASSLIIMPLLMAFFHGMLMCFLYHAKGEFGASPIVAWAVFLAPLAMWPALLLSPADNEAAGCTLMAVDLLLAFTVVRTAPVDLPDPSSSAVTRSVRAPQNAEVVDQDQLPAALSQIQQIIQTHELGPQERMREIAALSADYAEQVSDLTPVS